MDLFILNTRKHHLVWTLKLKSGRGRGREFLKSKELYLLRLIAKTNKEESEQARKNIKFINYA